MNCKADVLAPASAGSATKEPEVFGHPRGLLFIAGTELWDRISFHGMQALLVLYMVEQLLLPGHAERIAGFHGFRMAIESITGPLSTQALASQIFGLYIGLVYFVPVFGGLLGDRLLGRRRAVALGALLMTAGHFCLAFERTFLVALALLTSGAGLLRGNLVSQVGDLYSKDDPRRSAGFQIYVGTLNTGAFIAPLITGVLSQTYGWHYAFGFAGIGMLIGLALYVSGRRYLPADGLRRVGGVRTRLAGRDKRVVLHMCLLLPILALFWVAQSQVWNTYNLWVRDHVDLVVAGWRMPVPWLQAVDGLAAVVMVLPALVFWRWQRARAAEPDDLSKLAIGCFVFAGSLVWLACGQLADPASGSVPLLWALAFHFISNAGYVYFAPIAIALYSRSAPAAVNAMMIGVYYLAIFFGSTISGRLGGLYERVSPSEFWLLHAAVAGTGGVLILLLAPRMRLALKPQPA
jgi:proton-dependent oligopeptide transporter, POT family